MAPPVDELAGVAAGAVQGAPWGGPDEDIQRQIDIDHIGFSLRVTGDQIAIFGAPLNAAAPNEDFFVAALHNFGVDEQPLDAFRTLYRCLHPLFSWLRELFLHENQSPQHVRRMHAAHGFCTKPSVRVVPDHDNKDEERRRDHFFHKGIVHAHRANFCFDVSQPLSKHTIGQVSSVCQTIGQTDFTGYGPATLRDRWGMAPRCPLRGGLSARGRGAEKLRPDFWPA